MKRKSKFTFFELKVTFYFDLFQFFIGGYYDHINKAIHLSLIPTLFIKLENARPKVVVTEVDKANIDYLNKKLKETAYSHIDKKLSREKKMKKNKNKK